MVLRFAARLQAVQGGQPLWLAGVEQRCLALVRGQQRQLQIVVAGHHVQQLVRPARQGAVVQAGIQGVADLAELVGQLVARAALQLVVEGRVGEQGEHHHQAGAEQADAQGQAGGQAGRLHSRASST